MTMKRANIDITNPQGEHVIVPILYNDDKIENERELKNAISDLSRFFSVHSVTGEKYMKTIDHPFTWSDFLHIPNSIARSYGIEFFHDLADLNITGTEGEAIAERGF